MNSISNLTKTFKSLKIDGYPYFYVAYLVKYPSYLDFSILEFKSLMSLYKVNYKIDDSFNYNLKENPFVKFYTDKELSVSVVNSIYKRTVLIKNIFFPFSLGNSFEDLLSNTKTAFEEYSELKQEAESLATFKFIVEGSEFKINQKDQIDMIQQFDFLKFKANVDMKKAERNFVVYVNKQPEEFYFGKIVGDLPSGKVFYFDYDLRERKYLGPTSTDNRLAFIMSNLAQVSEGDIVYDPFAGTGSLLIPPSYFG